MIVFGIILIITATIGTLFILFRYEDYFIRIEVKVFGAIKRTIRTLRHRLGKWLLRDAERRTLSDEARERIAFEYAADNGIIFTKKAYTGAKTTSDEAFKELLIKIEGDR